MKKTLTLFLIFGFFIIINAFVSADAAQKSKTKAPAISQSLSPIIVKYRAGNYIGSMQDLEKLLETDSNNVYAKYYLALCYTRLGYKDKAQNLYREVSDKTQYPAISYYSKKALVCLNTPTDDRCTSVPKIPAEQQQEVDDITAFLMSGKMIHPSAMDKITKDRMERRIQSEEYMRRQEGLDYANQNPDSNIQLDENAQRQDVQDQNNQAMMPTNEEIAFALNTLSKIGMNPYGNNQFLFQSRQYPDINSIGRNNFLNDMFGFNASKPDLAQSLLYAQLMRPEYNAGIYYGI